MSKSLRKITVLCVIILNTSLILHAKRISFEHAYEEGVQRLQKNRAVQRLNSADREYLYTLFSEQLLRKADQRTRQLMVDSSTIIPAMTQALRIHSAQIKAQQEKQRREQMAADARLAQKLQAEEFNRRPAYVPVGPSTRLSGARESSLPRGVSRAEIEENKRLLAHYEQQHAQRRMAEEKIRREQQIAADEAFARQLAQQELNQSHKVINITHIKPAQSLPTVMAAIERGKPLIPSMTLTHNHNQILVFEVAVTQQTGLTCGYHTACNLLALQELLEEGNGIEAERIKKKSRAQEYITQTNRMLEDYEVDTLANRMRLKNFVILGQQGGTFFINIPLSPTQTLSPAEFERQQKIHEDFFKKIKRNKNAFANVALNLFNNHWVGASIIKKEGKISIYYMDSQNNGLPAESRQRAMIRWIAQQIA